MLLIEIEERAKLTDHMVTRYIVAVMGAWCAEFGKFDLTAVASTFDVDVVQFIATYPFDLAKTRLQIQNEIASAKGEGLKMEHHGMIFTAVNIVKKEGPLALWNGLLPMCQRHVMYAGSRLVLYEHLRKYFVDERGKMTLGPTVICGMTCGAFAALVSSPADLVKVQMQAEGRRLLQGKPPRFKGCWDVYKMVYKQSGVLGFWRGAVPNMQRAAMVNIGDLASYDYAKRLLMIKFSMSDGPFCHTLAAFVAGLVAAILGTPADVLKTRVMNQPMGPDGRGTLYRNLTDCFMQSVRNEGVFALYKGFIPMWIRLGPWALVNWIAFEQIMNLIGGKSF